MDSILSIIQGSKIAREWLNGGLLPLNISLCVVIGLFLWDIRRQNGRGWTKVEGVRTACALWWIFFGDGLRAGLAWLLLRVEVGAMPPFDAHDFISPEFVNVGFALAGIIGVVAALRCIKLFTPPSWGHSYWIASACWTVAWLTYIHQ